MVASAESGAERSEKEVPDSAARTCSLMKPAMTALPEWPTARANLHVHGVRCWLSAVGPLPAIARMPTVVMHLPQRRRMYRNHADP